MILRRGIGPVNRNWRYRVRDISEVVSPFAEASGKPRVHNIFFRPSGGAVRITVGGKEIHFAETLDEESGEAVVQWLRKHLPRSAREMWEKEQVALTSNCFRVGT